MKTQNLLDSETIKQTFFPMS